jgi:DNA replication protein DnaC
MKDFLREMHATMRKARVLSGYSQPEFQRRCAAAGWGYREVERELGRASSSQARLRSSLNAAIEQRRERRAQRRATAIARRIGAAGMPATLQQLEVNQLRGLCDARVLHAVDSHAISSGGLLLAGPTGLGKTIGAYLLAYRTVEEAYDANNTDEEEDRVVWVRALDLAVARSQQKLGSGEAEIVARAMRLPLLVLDDLGQESERDFVVLFDVSDQRYVTGLPTILTTGLTLAELEQRYGAPFVRRLVEAGGKRARVLDLFGDGAPR